ncbi:TPA: hypothetical protein ACJJ71_003756, partial [Enterobacter hormaechei subsp. xiangfangensis]
NGCQLRDIQPEIFQFVIHDGEQKIVISTSCKRSGLKYQKVKQMMMKPIKCKKLAVSRVSSPPRY